MSKKVIVDEKQIERVLTRGVDSVYPSKDALKKLLMSGKRIRLYQGFDPTGSELHIGHMVGIRKLAQFQQLGHEVIFLVGDGTGQSGDPSGKDKARGKFFTTEELRKNAKDYLSQAGHVVDFEGENPALFKFNGDWLNKLTLTDILGISEYFTLSQITERDMFQERMKGGEAVSLREAMYPLLQAYDSVAMGVDLEIGATEQTFNMLAGRDLVKKMQGREKFVLTTPLLTDATGRKLGKSEGNAIGITLSPSELFGGVMSLPDDVIVNAFSWLTDVPKEEITDIENRMRVGENPVEFKKKLAFEIVRDLNNENKANKAQASFEETFSKGGTPEDAKEVRVASGTMLVDVLIGEDLVKSKSDFRRLIKSGAISINGVKIENIGHLVESSSVVRVGKHRFIKLVV